MLLECRHSALAVIRSEHRAVFDGISDVRKLMAAAYTAIASNHVTCNIKKQPVLHARIMILKGWRLALSTSRSSTAGFFAGPML
jgi:hypothetical protein